MNPGEIYRFLKDLLTNGAEVFAAFFTGFILALVIVWVWRRWLFPRDSAEVALLKNQLQAEQGKTDYLSGAARKAEEKAHQLSAECESLKDKELELEEQVAAAERVAQKKSNDYDDFKKRGRAFVNDLKKQLEALTQQIQQVDDLQGKIWERPVRGVIPKFRSLEGGKPPIIAVVNLKGGVGKTSLTANLAASLMQEDKRVLVVDLDYQASLTALCMDQEGMGRLKLGDGHFVHNVLKAKGDRAKSACNNLARTRHERGWILAGAEQLADVEEHTKASWLLNPDKEDYRYILRGALHDPMVQGQFDAILLDCPPRLSMGCINALAACDWVLIPVLFDKTSTDAVPRLLSWLRILKENVCPDLDVLGVVGNRSFRRVRLTSREKSLWEELEKSCTDAWREPVHAFRHLVPNSAHISNAADNRVFAADHQAVAPVFSALTHEIFQQMQQRA